MRWELRPNVSDANHASPASRASRRDLQRQLRLEAKLDFILRASWRLPTTPRLNVPSGRPPSFLPSFLRPDASPIHSLSLPLLGVLLTPSLTHGATSNLFQGRDVAHDTSKFHPWSDSSLILQVVVSILASICLYTHLFPTSCSVGERRSRHLDYVAPWWSQGVGAT